MECKVLSVGVLNVTFLYCMGEDSQVSVFFVLPGGFG